MKLTELSIGKVAIISSINLGKNQTLRLNYLGLTVGAKVKIIRRAPLFCPIEIEVKEVFLAMRKVDAEKIQVII